MRNEEIVKWTRGPDVLDVGCAGHKIEIGSPYWLHGRLRALMPHVVGVDISTEHVAFLSASGFADVFVQDAEDLNLGRRFNTIVAGEVIEHLSNPLQFLLSAKRHLAPAGRIVLTTPYPFSLAYGMYAVWKYPNTCQNREHACWFCPTTLTELASRAGLNVRHFELIEDYRPDAPSFVYRSGLRVLRAMRRCLPLRFRTNGMLFVLEDSCGAH